MIGVVTRRHASVKRYRDLARASAAGDLDREVLLDGLHLLIEAHASGIPVETAAFEHATLDDPTARRLAEDLKSAGTEVLIVSRGVLEAMSPVKTPSGAIGIARRRLTPLAEALRGPAPLALVACDVQDPGNVGALMRTAEAAGATAFVACGASADPLGWKALRGSMGSALRLPVARAGVDDTLRECRGAGLRTTALAAGAGEPLFSADFRGPTALLLGSEGGGLPPETLARVDRLVSIPMKAPVESLNVAVAAALALYEAFRQRRASSSSSRP